MDESLDTYGQPPSKRGRRVLGKLVGVYLIGLMFLGGFVAGIVVGEKRGAAANSVGESVRQRLNGNVSISPNEDGQVNFNLFWRVWETIQKKYVHQPVDDKTLFHGALAGLVDSLGDPYSVYMPPKDAEAFSNDLKGEFGGIGAEIGIKDDRLVIVAPLPDSPAEKAGLRAKDFIVQIDATSTVSMSVEQAVSLIRGPKGTEVTLTIFREQNGEEPLTFKIARDTIVVKSVRSEMKTTPGGGLVGYIEIRQFNEDTVPLFDRAVQEVLAKNPRAVVIDMRSNPGGYLDAAIDVAGTWVGSDVVVVERKMGGEEEAFRASRRARLAGMPTIVLVNGGSASGSEIVAGALQDGQFATLVGEKTFGKGSVQDYEELPDGGALKLTIAEWLTPKLRAINNVGIEPDVTVAYTKEDYNADRDPQLEKALELIDARKAAARR